MSTQENVNIRSLQMLHIKCLTECLIYDMSMYRIIYMQQMFALNLNTLEANKTYIYIYIYHRNGQTYRQKQLTTTTDTHTSLTMK